MKTRLRGNLTIALILGLNLMITLPVMNVMVRESQDMKNHYLRALELPAETTNRAVGHVLFHAVVKVCRSLLPAASKETVLIISLMTFMQPLPVIIFLLLKKTARGLLPDLFTGALALGLTIAAPITIWLDDRYMIGYINSIVYHNPTLIALRLFAIPLSLLSFWAINNRSYRDFNHRFFWLLTSASIMMLATLSKPSYTIALIPGLILFAIWRRIHGHSVDWVFMLWGVFVPAGLILGIEYLYTFHSGIEHGGVIVISPSAFMRAWIPFWRMPIQLALSLVFPIAVFLLYRREATKHLYLNMSWIVFAVGAMYTYLLAQDGPGFKSGNFLWSSYSAVFVLMYASLTFLLELHILELQGEAFKTPGKGLRMSKRAAIAYSLFAVHVVSGLFYCIRSLEFSALSG